MNKGSSILEVLIAIAILTLGISAAILIVFGNQSLKVDNETNSEALYKAKGLLERARASSTIDFLSINTIPPSSTSTSNIYSQGLGITDLTQCRKQATSTVTWWASSTRSQTIELITNITDIAGLFALGGDCATEPPEGGWNPPTLFARDTLNPGKFNALDALQKIVYLGSDNTEPYLFIADTRAAVFDDQHEQPFIIPQAHDDYTNLFNSDGETIDEINDIDAYKDISNGKTYVFIAMASTTAQLAVIDVTNINNPELVAIRKLKDIYSTDSTAWGWRLYYYDGRLFITSRETGGPELHIFDVEGLLTNSSNPYPSDLSEDELGNKEINTTVNDFVVRDDLIYFADESDARGPLLIYDVATPTSITEIIGARTMFLDNAENPNNDENGLSIYLLGNKLYFGRQKTSSSPEFYILDASNPRTAIGGLPIFGSLDPKKELGTDVTGITVIGRFAFLATYNNSSGGLKVFDISNPFLIQPINLSFNFGNKPAYIDYDSDFIYATGESTPNFQMLCSGPIVGGECNN